MVYPNSTPEFRILQNNDGTTQMQVRYINAVIGYTGKWQSIPVVKEKEIN